MWQTYLIIQSLENYMLDRFKNIQTIRLLCVF